MTRSIGHWEVSVQRLAGKSICYSMPITSKVRTYEVVDQALRQVDLGTWITGTRSTAVVISSQHRTWTCRAHFQALCQWRKSRYREYFLHPNQPWTGVACAIQNFSSTVSKSVPLNFLNALSLIAVLTTVICAFVLLDRPSLYQAAFMSWPFYNLCSNRCWKIVPGFRHGENGKAGSLGEITTICD